MIKYLALVTSIRISFPKGTGGFNQIVDSKGNTSILAKLSEWEIEFLKLTCTEHAYKEIADKMNVSVRTVEGYRDILCEKLNVKTRVGLAMYAVKNGIAKL